MVGLGLGPMVSTIQSPFFTNLELRECLSLEACCRGKPENMSEILVKDPFERAIIMLTEKIIRCSRRCPRLVDQSIK